MSGEKVCRCQIIGWARDPYEPHIPSQPEWEQADDCPVHPLPTPEPSEVAETTAGEREVEALAKVINPSAFTADFRASQDGARSMARAVLASDWLAALLDRERREANVEALRAVAADIVWDYEEHDVRRSGVRAWLNSMAAEIEADA